MRGDLLGRMKKHQALNQPGILQFGYPLPLAAGALAKMWIIKELRGQEVAISFPSNPFRKQAFVGPARNEISIAFAMLTH